MEIFHLASLAFCAVIIITSDHMGLMWILGRRQMLDANSLKRRHRLMWVGVTAMVATGVILVVTGNPDIIYTPKFVAKMFFVLGIIANGLGIGRLMSVASQSTFAQVPSSTKAKLFLSGAISASFWVMATILGFSLTWGVVDYAGPNGTPLVNEAAQKFQAQPTGTDGQDLVSEAVPTEPTQGTKKYTAAQIATHNAENDCYTIINGKVYDVTKYIPWHPGGKKRIIDICGVDGTQKFMGKHASDKKPNFVLQSMEVGELAE